MVKELKQVIVVRTDLKMGKGKLAVQVAHAAVTAADLTRRVRKEWYDEWLRQGQKKIVVKVRGPDELKEIFSRACEEGLPAVIIADQGLTQLPPGTVTAVGIGPAPSELIDKITGHLKLL